MKYLQLSNYTKNISMLSIGSFFGQVTGFFGSILMTRFYPKNEIGAMMLIISITGMVIPVVNCKLDYAIVKEKDKKLVYPLIILALLVGLLVSVFTSILSAFYLNTKKEIISIYLSVSTIFLILFLNVFTNVFRSYNNRIDDYNTMTFVLVKRKLAEDACLIVGGLLSPTYFTLLFSKVIGQFFAIKQEGRNLFKHFHKIFLVNKQIMRFAFNKHKKQVYYSMPAALMNSASYSLIGLFIGELYGLETLAVYSISFSVLGFPLSIISGNISKVYFSEAAKEYSNTGSFIKSTHKTIKVLFSLSIFVYIGMYYIIPFCVPIVYGPEYYLAGKYIKIMSNMFIIRFITSSIATGMIVANKQEFDAILQFGFLLVSILTYYYALSNNLTIHDFLMVFSLGYATIYLVYFLMVYNLSKMKFR